MMPSWILVFLKVSSASACGPSVSSSLLSGLPWPDTLTIKDRIAAGGTRQCVIYSIESRLEDVPAASCLMQALLAQENNGIALLTGHCEERRRCTSRDILCTMKGNSCEKLRRPKLRPVQRKHVHSLSTSETWHQSAAAQYRG